MERLLAIAVATVRLGCGPSFAQTVVPGTGTTSPLGVPDTISPAGLPATPGTVAGSAAGSGTIPLGSTEIGSAGISTTAATSSAGC
jgi:hypothetical protein